MDINFQTDSIKQAKTSSYIKVPKFLNEHKFRNISIASKYLYALMLDRENLSILNNWRDKCGQVFIYFSVDEISKLLNISLPTVTKLTKELVVANLIEIRRQGLGKPSMIYVIKPFGYVDN